MKTRIEAILARELNKLDVLSRATTEPLPSSDIKSLDTLVKAYRSFVDPANKPAPTPGSAQPAESGPASQSDNALLESITSSGPDQT